MADPDFLGRTLTDPAERAQLRAEWTDFLRTPFSPVAMLDAILSTDFTEVDASTEAVTGGSRGGRGAAARGGRRPPGRAARVATPEPPA